MLLGWCHLLLLESPCCQPYGRSGASATHRPRQHLAYRSQSLRFIVTLTQQLVLFGNFNINDAIHTVTVASNFKMLLILNIISLSLHFDLVDDLRIANS